MTFEGEPGEMSEAGELPTSDEREEGALEGGVEEVGGDQDPNPPASHEQVEEDDGRDRAEG